jgi:hypothetical protein
MRIAASTGGGALLVAVVGTQLLLTPSAAFVERVTWDGDVA